MKKFLTVLLVIAVMFTFSFGSAFAATYTYGDYQTAAAAFKQTQMDAVKKSAEEAIKKVDFDAETGYDTNGYTKAAYEAAAAEVIADAEAAIKNFVNGVLSSTFATIESTTNAAPDATVFDASSVTVGSYALDDLANLNDTTFGTAMAAETDVLQKVQAPLTKTDLQNKIADIKLGDYSNKVVTGLQVSGTDVSPLDYVQAVIKTANDAIIAGDAEATDAAKFTAYKNALETFLGVNGMDNALLKTIAEQEADATEGLKDVNGAVNKYLDAAIELYTRATTGLRALVTEDADLLGSGKLVDAFSLDDVSYNDMLYTAKDGSKNATVFGVEVANCGKITKAEALAINNAMYDAIVKSAEVIRVYAGSDATVIAALHADDDAILDTVAKTMQVADKYEEVVKAGETLKATYRLGAKVYDDAKVDEAVAEAKELVYDLSVAIIDNATTYIANAANDIYSNTDGLDNLQTAAAGLTKFNKAVADAQAKMFSAWTDETTNTPAVADLYGDDKTPEADYVYLKGTYSDDAADAWLEIAVDAYLALDDAQSYAEIDAIMADAAAQFAELELLDDDAKVDPLITQYQSALDEYEETLEKAQGLTGTHKYNKAYAVANANGKALIGDAATEAGVKAAYEEAKKLYDNPLTDTELADVLKAVDAQVDKLPTVLEMKATDLDAVMAAYDAYVAYVKAAGEENTTTEAALDTALEAVLGLVRADLVKEMEDLDDALPTVIGPAASDAELAKLLDMKADIEAMAAKVDAFNDRIDTIEYGIDEDLDALTTDSVDADIQLTVAAVDYTGLTDLDAVLAIDGTENGTIWGAEIEAAERALVKAAKDGATEADVKAALDAYNALSERQQLTLDDVVLPLVEIVKDKVAFDDVDAKAYLQDLSVKARSVKTAKGNVKVTVVADVDVLEENGYTVEYKFYRSTKSNKGFGKAKKVSEEATYTNTTGKKGTKYYYKAVVVAKDAEGNVVAQTPLKHCLYASRTWSK